MKIKKLSRFSEKLVGLAFRKNITPVYFETRFGIHTFFVKQPIDIIICDDNFVVRKIVRNIKPWRVLVWNPIYKIVLELPSNHKKYLGIGIGDKMKMIDLRS